MTQEFNSNPESVFGDLYHRAENYIIAVIADIMEEANVLCINELSDNDCLIGTARDLTKSYIQWLTVAQELGIESDPRIIDLFEFCDGSVNKTFDDFTMVEAESLIEVDLLESSGRYFIELGTSNDIFQVQYVMKNLLGEHVLLPDSTINWVDVSGEYGSGATEGTFIYENGTIQLNKTDEVILALSLCQSDPAACNEWYFFSIFNIYRNNCQHASVYVFWEYP